jgi:hypothetical protein
MPFGGLTMFRHARTYCFLLPLPLLIALRGVGAEEPPVKVDVHWDKVVRESKTVPTVLFLGTPKTKRGSPLHDPMLNAIKELGADDVRYAPCNLYPRLSIAELEPPTKTSTSWDFSLIDPYTEDAMSTLDGHPIELNFSTIPEWMFKTPKPVAYPSDPEQFFYDYEQGAELRDPTYREVADYFARVVSWYVNGGFKDELGKWHNSGHHYKVDYWGVLNEPDIEHGLSPEVYTRIYDAVVKAVHQVSPQTKFVSMSSSYPGSQSKFFDYFLDPRNHQPGIPLDMISYHFYAVPGADEPEAVHPYTFFDQADRFLEVVGYIETIRHRLSPQTGTMVDEVGTMLPSDWDQGKPGYVFKPIAPSYWNLSAAVYAYVFAGLARQGIDVATESLVPGYPGQFPSIAILDWDTGQPNARYRVLKLIIDNFRPGDKIVDTQNSSGEVMTQGFVSSSGERKLLIVNKRDREFRLTLPGLAGGKLEVVDRTSGSNPPPASTIEGDSFSLGGLGVAVVTLP